MTTKRINWTERYTTKARLFGRLECARRRSERMWAMECARAGYLARVWAD